MKNNIVFLLENVYIYIFPLEENCKTELCYFWIIKNHNEISTHKNFCEMFYNHNKYFIYSNIKYFE